MKRQERVFLELLLKVKSMTFAFSSNAFLFVFFYEIYNFIFIFMYYLLFIFLSTPSNWQFAGDLYEWISRLLFVHSAIKI